MMKTIYISFYGISTLLMVAIAHMHALASLSSLQIRHDPSYHDYSNLHIRTNGGKRPREPLIDTRGPKVARVDSPSRSTSTSPVPRLPPRLIRPRYGLLQTAVRGRASIIPPPAVSISRLSSTDTSDSDIDGAKNTIKASVKGKGTVAMTPDRDKPVQIDDQSVRIQKHRGVRVQAKVAVPDVEQHSGQQSAAKIITKGGQVKATIKPANSGELEAWGAEGYQRIYAKGGRTASLRAKATLNENGDVGRRARIKASLGPFDGGEITATAQDRSQSLSSTSSSGLSAVG